MALRHLKWIAIFVLLIWFSWPIVELFDTWDKPVDAGNDSQYSFIVLGICAGAVYIFSQRRTALWLTELTLSVAQHARSLILSVPFVKFLDWTPDTPGPPLDPHGSITILRI
jgi:hypothetical protein